MIGENEPAGHSDPLGAIWNDQPYPDDEEFTEWFNGLTEAQQILFPTHWLCVEVYNGGFHQYFTNLTGHHAPEAVVGFRKLELTDIAAIVQRAVDLFGSPFPRQREAREEFLESFEGEEEVDWNPFFKLDDEFYQAIKIPGAPKRFDDDQFTVAAKNLVKKVKQCAE